MDNILEEQFQFASSFFESAIQKNRLFHSYLLTGNDNNAKYAFALNIARILNCMGDKSENCECLNCKWIRNNNHPAVMTFSPIDFIHVNPNSKARENITVAQARYIKEELNKTSTYHRIIIITGASEGQDAAEQSQNLTQYKIKAPASINKEQSEERTWAPNSLKLNTFTTETANTLLKTIEEPFDRVTFFFLANSPEDLIATIVSRCQCVNIPSSRYFKKNYSILEKIIKNYPAKDTLTSILLSEHVQNLAKEHGMPVIEILEILEDYYSQNLGNNIENKQNYRKIITFLNKIEIAKTKLYRYVDTSSVLENLFFE